MTRPTRRSLLALGAALALVGAAGPAVHTGSIRPGGPSEVVLYNDDRALIRGTWMLDVERGRNEVVLEGVPARIDSTSVRLSGDGFSVLSQAYRFDLWNGPRLFRSFLGDSIFYRQGGRTYRGLLAGIDGDDLYILRADSAGLLTMTRRSSLSEIELRRRADFASRPSLQWKIDAARRGSHPATLSYLTAGLGWRAEYVAVLDKGERTVELTGWATLVNHSGASYERARVSLVAGELHREGDTPDRGGAAEGAATPAPPAVADLFAYHLYPLPEPVDLKNLETVQIALVPPTRVEARRSHAYDGARDGGKVRARIEFENAKGAGLGIPLPAGRVRVYAHDPSGAVTLVGEDALGHTPAGGNVKIFTGVAFDLVGERVRTAHTRVSRNVTEDQFEIRLRNGGSKPATVTVVENLYGSWEITAKTADFRKKDAETVEFDVPVPAGGASTLRFTVRYTF